MYWLFSSLSNVIVKTGTVSCFIFLVSCEAARQRASLSFLLFVFFTIICRISCCFLLSVVWCVFCLVFTRSAYFKPIVFLVSYSVVWWANLALLHLSNITFFLHFLVVWSFFVWFSHNQKSFFLKGLVSSIRWVSSSISPSCRFCPSDCILCTRNWKLNPGVHFL